MMVTYNLVPKKKFLICSGLNCLMAFLLNLSTYSLSSYQEIEKMIVLRGLVVGFLRLTFDVEVKFFYLPQLMVNIFSSSGDIFKQLGQYGSLTEPDFST